MNDQRIAILTDTGTDTPAPFVQAHDIRVVPLRIIFSNGTFESGVTITPSQVVERMKTELPTTSLPSPETIRQSFEQARADGYTSAIFVAISSGLSATCDTVRLVASQIENFPITVIDTKNIGVAAGMIVMEAVRKIEAGVPFAQLEELLEGVVRKTSVFFSVKTLDYLRKGGRISEAVYRIGSVLNIKPVLTCNKTGHYVMAKKVRGWERALNTQVALAQEKMRQYTRVRIAICCADACPIFDELEEKIRANFNNIVEVIRSDISADLLVHTGPELVGIGVQEA